MRYSRQETERLLASGELSALQVYALQHQHPLNQLCHFIGIPTILVGIAWLPVAWFVWGTLGWEVWLACQVVGWFFQLLGHRIEGNKPAFVDAPAQLLVGPVFFVLKAVRALQGRPAIELPPPREAGA